MKILFKINNKVTNLVATAASALCELKRNKKNTTALVINILMKKDVLCEIYYHQRLNYHLCNATTTYYPNEKH